MFDSASIKSTARKAAAALIGFVLALVLLAALLLTGMKLLVSAATMALTPHVGPAGALAITGLLCVLLVILFVYRLAGPSKTAPEAKDSSRKKIDSSAPRSPVQILRSAIKDNPLEAAALAFAAGLAGHDDSRLRQLLLQGGMVMMEKPGTSETPAADASVTGTENPV